MTEGRIEKAQGVFFWIAAGVLACLAFINTLGGLPTFPVNTIPPTFPRETIFFTLTAFAICFAALRGGGELARNKKIAFYLLASYVAWAVIVTIWATNRPGHSRGLIEMAFFSGWAFALSGLLLSEERIWNLTRVLGFTGGAVGAAVAFGYFALEIVLATWPFGNANAAGMFCAFTTVINTGLLLEGIRKHEPAHPQVVLPAVSILFTVVGLMLTFSKGALLGLVVGEAVLLWQYFPEKRKLIALGIAVVFVVGVSGYVAMKAGKETPDDERAWTQRLQDTTSGFRVMAYEASMKQIGGAPIGGRGLGSFYAFFPLYSLPDISGHKRMGDTVFHAHSNILEIGTETGIIGMLLFIAMTMYLGILPLKKKEPTKEERNRLEAIWIGVFLMISTHALVAVHFYWTETVVYYWTAVGVLLALGRSRGSRLAPKHVIPLLSVAIVALAGLWYFGVWEELLGRMHVARREHDLRIVRPKDKQRQTMRQKGLRPGNPEYDNLEAQRQYLYSRILEDLNAELGLVHMQRRRTDTYYQLGSAYFNIGHPREGLYFFKELAKIAPEYVHTHYFTGRSYDLIWRTDKGKGIPVTAQEAQEYQKKTIKSVEHYLELNPRSKESGGASLFLSGLYEHRREWDKAIKVIETFINENARLKDFGEAAMRLARLYKGRRMLPEVPKILESYLERYPQGQQAAEATKELASSYARLGKLPEALMAIKNHLETNPDSHLKKELRRLRRHYEEQLRRQQATRKAKRHKD
jgi:O-antigen ligase/tetratricopeptide (TPR) repeat protein